MSSLPLFFSQLQNSKGLCHGDHNSCDDNAIFQFQCIFSTFFRDLSKDKKELLVFTIDIMFVWNFSCSFSATWMECYSIVAFVSSYLKDLYILNYSISLRSMSEQDNQLLDPEETNDQLIEGELFTHFPFLQSFPCRENQVTGRQIAFSFKTNRYKMYMKTTEFIMEFSNQSSQGDVCPWFRLQLLAFSVLTLKRVSDSSIIPRNPM